MREVRDLGLTLDQEEDQIFVNVRDVFWGQMTVGHPSSEGKGCTSELHRGRYYMNGPRRTSRDLEEERGPQGVHRTRATGFLGPNY